MRGVFCAFKQLLRLANSGFAQSATRPSRCLASGRCTWLGTGISRTHGHVQVLQRHLLTSRRNIYLTTVAASGTSNVELSLYSCFLLYDGRTGVLGPCLGTLQQKQYVKVLRRLLLQVPQVQ